MKFFKRVGCIIGMSLMLSTSIFGYHQVNVIDETTGMQLQIANLIERTVYRGAFDIGGEFYDYMNGMEIPEEAVSEMDVFKVKMPADKKVAKLLIDLNKYPTAKVVEVMPLGGRYNEQLDMIARFGQSYAEALTIQKDEKGQGYVYVEVPTHYFINEDQVEGLYVLNFNIFDEAGNMLFYVRDINILLDEEMGTETFTNKPKAIDLVIDGYVQNEVLPVQKAGSILVPLRVVTDSLGGAIKYDEKTQQIDILKDQTQIRLQVGSTQAMINGKESKLAAAPEIINGVTYVPIRLISEAFNCEVKWYADKNVVTVNSEATRN